MAIVLVTLAAHALVATPLVPMPRHAASLALLRTSDILSVAPPPQAGELTDSAVMAQSKERRTFSVAECAEQVARAGCLAEYGAAKEAFYSACQALGAKTSVRVAGGGTAQSLITRRGAEMAKAETFQPWRYVQAAIELIVTLSVLSACTSMLAFASYDPMLGVDGSAANFEIYNKLAQLAEAVP